MDCRSFFMDINIKNLISISEANQNFSRVVKEVDKKGTVIIVKNNKPKYVLSPIDGFIDLTDDEKIEITAKRILKKYKYAFEVLGQ